MNAEPVVRGLLTGGLMLALVLGLFLFIDWIYKASLRRLFLLVPRDRSFDPGHTPVLSSDTVDALRRWQNRRLVLWSATIFAFGFTGGYHPRDLALADVWFLLPLPIVALVHDFRARCPRCGLLMIRQLMVLMPRACVKCGIRYGSG